MPSSKNSKENKSKQNLIKKNLTKILKKTNKSRDSKINNKKTKSTSKRNSKNIRGDTQNNHKKGKYNKQHKNFVQKGGNYDIESNTHRILGGGVEDESCPKGQFCISTTMKNIFFFSYLCCHLWIIMDVCQWENTYSTLFVSNPSSQPEVHVSPGVIINPSLSGNGVTLSD